VRARMCPHISLIVFVLVAAYRPLNPPLPTPPRATWSRQVEAGERAAAGALLPRPQLVEELRRVRELPNGCWRRVTDHRRLLLAATTALAAPAVGAGGAGDAALVAGAPTAAAAAPAATCAKAFRVCGPFDPDATAALLRGGGRRSSVTRKLSVEDEAAERLAEMRAAMGVDHDEGGGGGGGGRRRQSVKDRMGAMEQKSGGDGDGESKNGKEGVQRTVTAAPVAARSRRVGRLLARVHEEQQRLRAEMAAERAAVEHNAAAGGAEGAAAAAAAGRRNSGKPSAAVAEAQRRQRGDGDDQYAATVAAAAAAVLRLGGSDGGGGGAAWACAICSKRNSSGLAVCETCGRPRGVARKEVFPGGKGLGGAFGLRPAAQAASGGQTPGSGDGAAAAAQLPQKNNSMMAELQAKLKRRSVGHAVGHAV